MAEFEFSRRRPFGDGNGPRVAAGDLLVSQVTRAGGRKALAVRIHRDTLDRLSWLLGDHVTLGIADGQVTLRRVRGPKDGGVKISPVNRTSGHGAARFSAEGEVLESVLPEGKPFRASLAAIESGQAVFVKE